MTQEQPLSSEPPLAFKDLLGLTLQLNGRIDTLWQRVIYSHAAMVGVMVFFASAPEPFVLARVLVMLFYTMNSVVTFVAFRDTFAGLRAAVDDLRRYPEAGGHVYRWIEAQDFRRHALRRAAILAALWVIIAYLILGPLIGLY